MHHSLQFDRRLVALSVVLLLTAAGLAVAIGFAGFARSAVLAVVALAIAPLVLALLPTGTRGLVLTVMLGLATGIAAVNLFAVQILQGPITKEFGWTQTDYTQVILIGTIMTVLSSPLIGVVFDKYGVRPFAIGCTVIFGLTLISLYFLTPSFPHFYGLFALIPLLGAGTSSVAYARVIARWFDRRRGQALGAALAGIGIGGVVLSAVTQGLVQTVGWRGAWAGLGALLIVIVLPLLLVCLKDTPQEAGLGIDGQPLDAARNTAASQAAPAIGYSMAMVFGLPRFWWMMAAFLVLAIGIGGVMLQLVPIMEARGVPRSQAVVLQQTLAIALILGRAFAGLLMDRYFAPYVASLILLFPMVGVALLAGGATGGAALVAAVCLGLAAGAELDVIAYLTAKYFGTIAYARVYGLLYSAWTLGSGTAPLFTSMAFDRTGSHTAILWVYVGVFALAAVMIARLGAYPRLPVATANEPARA